MSHLLFYTLLIISLPVFSQIKWDGGAGTDHWNDPLNWSNNTIPASTDDVVLDNTVVAGDYIVILPANAIIVKSILIDPSVSQSIELVLPKENIFVPGLTISGPGYGLTINRGGIFRNSSGVSSGTPLMVTDSIRINNDGKFIINTLGAHAANVDRLSGAAGTENGIVEFDIPDASTTISLSGRTYGKLVLQSTAFGRALNYTAAGTNKVIIRSDLEIGDSVSFNLNFSDSILIKGNLIQGASTFNLGNTTRSVVVGISGNISLPEEGKITETGTGVQQLLLNGAAEQQLNIKGQVLNHVSVNKAGTGNARLLSVLSLPYALHLRRGNLISTIDNILILKSDCVIESDSLSDKSFIDGPIKKEGLSNSRFMFPVGKAGKMRWLELLSATGNFIVEYFNNNPKLINNIMGNGIDHISGIEYWNISGGNSAIVKLSFSDPNSGGVTALSQLRIAQLHENIWQNAGITDFRGTPGMNGWVSSSAASGFSAGSQLFALASAIGQENPLPIFFRQFIANTINNKVVFKWSVDKDHTATGFELQESDDNLNYRTIYFCKAQQLLTDYYYQSERTRTAKKYYRVRAVDKDGSTYYFSKILFITVNPQILVMNTINVNSFLNLRIMMNAARRIEFVIYNVAGSLQKKIQMDVQKGSLDLQIMVADLPAGNYICSMLTAQEKLASFRFVKR